MKETTKNYSKRKKVNNMFESESVYISPDTTEPHVDMGHEDNRSLDLHIFCLSRLFTQ